MVYIRVLLSLDLQNVIRPNLVSQYWRLGFGVGLLSAVGNSRYSGLRSSRMLIPLVLDVHQAEVAKV